MVADEQQVVESEAPSPQGSRRRSILRMLGWALIALFVATGAVLLGSALWIRRTFGPISIDQMLMSLPGAGGAEVTGAESGYVSDFVWQAIALPLICVVVLFMLSWLVRRVMNRRQQAIASEVSDRGRYGRPHASRPRFSRWIPGLFAAVTFVSGAAVFAQTIGLAQYVRSATTTLSMMDYYVAPYANDDTSVVFDISDGKSEPKNLVTIYLESADDAFSDADQFEANLLQPLQEATEGWASIPALRVYEGGGWTMAGLVGTQCGIPLRGPGIGENDINSNEIGADAEEYLPGAYCLGDALADVGYTNVYLGGADAGFASKGVFFSNHGFDEVKDLEYWIEQGETELSAWGLSDRALMEQAKAEVTRLHEAGEPFNLTMLTLDFHEPAHLFDYCPQTTEADLSSALICSMQQVAGFIDYMEEKGYLDDTVVVVMADHPKMVADGGYYSNELSGVALDERLLFNRIWTPDGESDWARDDIDQLSMYATTLDLLDLGQADGRAGVGLSALTGTIENTALNLQTDEYLELLQSRSADLYSWLWNDDDGSLISAEAES